jgi:DNA topoisomerase-1
MLSEVVKMRIRSERLLTWMDEEEIRVLRWLKKRDRKQLLPTPPGST